MGTGEHRSKQGQAEHDQNARSSRQRIALPTFDTDPTAIFAVSLGPRQNNKSQVEMMSVLSWW
jgi:hypothetical protein